ncbi:hypothetical protein PV08_01774 [Exophiala spinifera]|uniref:EamA domain-containing protein n=1 Tax=Exophiala spinifera TaxID=91928 RepID=A0A0D2CCG6_9EURO|nr:uncharacterized protein PV08_01774 [Exophiala spinifera]KIW21194.1 hypothetical protein PV08_01774 [Exophiala spinifera]
MTQRRRRAPKTASQSQTQSQPPSPSLQVPSLSPASRSSVPAAMDSDSRLFSALRRQPVWIVLAVSSGACAAINGVFAKLTTTALTSTLSSHIATFFSLSPSNKVVEFLVRGTFFLLNLAFNAAMWALFTAALTRGDSTTRVSIVNVSANFVITAVLGWMVFGEKLSGLWFLGAALLAVGNVVIGRREEGKKPGGTIGLDETRDEAIRQSEDDGEEEEEAARLLGRDAVELDDELGGGRRRRSSEEETRNTLKRGVEVDDPI